MERLVENMPYVEAFRGPKVDPLTFISNSPNVGETSRPTHGCVDQMRSLIVLAYLTAKI